VTAVYLAASSRDLPRAKRWRDALLQAGLVVASTWIESVEAEGAANPQTASREQRQKWAGACYAEVRSANIVWFLAPPPDAPSCGAWCELGAADTGYAIVICSGPGTEQSIFCALGEEYSSDFLAFAAIVRAHEQKLFNPPIPETDITGAEEW